MTTWVLFAGMPGTGKSTLARALARRLQAAVLNKDRVRSALFPGRFTDYTEEQNELAMGAMLASAGYLTAQERTRWVFFDGRTFSSRRQRQEVIQAADRAGAGWRILHVWCTDAVAEARLAKGNRGHPAKDRGPELYRAVQSRFEAFVEPVLAVDTTEGFAGQLEAIQAYLAHG